MKISVAYNGDLQLIEGLRKFKAAVNVFGAPSSLITGGGRSSFILPTVTSQDIEKAVAKAHECGIQFNYVMNSSCMGNNEYSQAYYRQIVEHLSWISDIGVDWVTIAIPYLIEICRKKFPHLKVSLSTFAMVESVERARYYDELGVSEITVRENINRNFNLLKEIQKNVACEIQVLANQTCLYQCPFQFYHDNLASHASQTSHNSTTGFVDYCVLGCTKRRFSKPEEIIKSGWIRPEDLHHYEDIGIVKFKLSDRSKSTPWLLRAVQAYSERKYNGNLAEILNFFLVGSRRHNIPSSEVAAAKEEPTSRNTAQKPESLREMRQLVKAFTLLDVNIDNRELDNFIEFFKGRDCRAVYCSECQYCKKIAERVVKFPQEESVSKALKQIDAILDGLIAKEV
jgi:collagenase-like PrtC family protease